MVIGFKHQDATWTAYVSERLPHALDMEIRKYRAEFYMEAAKLTPEQLQEVLPAGFSMTSLFEEFPGIARYPIDKWEEAGEPLITVKNWCNLCMRVASGNLIALGSIFETASKIIEKEEATEKFWDSEQQQWHLSGREPGQTLCGPHEGVQRGNPGTPDRGS